MGRARRAITSARLLLADGDINGSCNRAYYAMFDAARAAIAVSGAPVDADTIKTHSGLISAFSLCLVKPGRLPVESGKALNRVAELRLISDYIGRDVTAPQAKTAIDQAETFIGTIEREFSKEIKNSRS